MVKDEGGNGSTLLEIIKQILCINLVFYDSFIVQSFYLSNHICPC